MRALLDLAGDPDRRMRVVLIAGTKGKGYTAAFLASILHAAPSRAGLFTSPHLQTYRERVRIDGAMLGEPDFERAIDQLRPIVARLRRAHPAADARNRRGGGGHGPGGRRGRDARGSIGGRHRGAALVAAGGHAEAARAGKQRLEGKLYVVEDGDVLNVRFNV